MTQDFTLTVELDSRSEPIDIEVTCEGSWQNDGIGPYEYWGFKGVDRGTNYIEIEDVYWDKSDFTEEEQKQIELLIDKQLSDWATKMEEDNKYSSCDVYDDES